MDEMELKQIIYDYIKEICHNSQMQVFATSSYQKNYFQMQIDDLINDMISFILMYIGKEIEEKGRDTQELSGKFDDQKQRMPDQSVPGGLPDAPENETGQRSFTLQELAYYDGSEGKPAYVAVNGVIYDVSDMIGWAGGTHFGLYAGRNHTEAFMNCHEGRSKVLEKLPRVGILQQ